MTQQWWLSDHQYLQFNPFWSKLAGEWGLLAFLAVCAVPVGLILWLYRYELKLVPRGTALGLLGLRTVIAVLILFLVCLRPVHIQLTPHKFDSRVLIAVDISDSMAVTDPQRTPLEKLRLAAALGSTVEGVSAEQIAGWIEAYQKTGQIEWLRADEFPGDPARRTQEETRRRQGHDRLCEQVDALTRSAIARKLLSEDGRALVKKLAASHRVELIAFAADARFVKVESLGELFRKEVKAGKPGEEEPATPTSATNLKRALERALELASEDRGKVVGLVLLSDGRNTVPGRRQADTPAAAAEVLAERKIGIYPLAIGAAGAPPDIAVKYVLAPPAAFKDVEIKVDVSARVTGMKPQTLRVILHRPGEIDKPLLPPDEIKHDGKDQDYDRSYTLKMDRTGRQVIQASIVPAQEIQKEATTANNFGLHVINVAEEKSRVLVVDGEARWEFHYLFSALYRDTSMELKSVVFTQPRVDKVTEAELEKVGNPSLSLPPAPEPDKDPLFEYDCIILGDVSPEHLPRPDRLRLERYVAERGGTLVMLAGKRFMPAAFHPFASLDGKDKADEGLARTVDDPIFKMLPIERPRIVTPTDGFPVTLTGEGKQAPYLLLDPGDTDGKGDFQSRVNRINHLPAAEALEDAIRHYWGVVGKLKPGATALAYLGGDDRRLTPKARQEKERENALFVYQPYGLGHVLFLGIDSTWRWRYRIGDEYHHRFWSQTIRWAATSKPLVTGNKYVRFGTPQGVYRPATPVKVVARLQDEIKNIPAFLEARARILRKDGDTETTVALVPLSRRQLQQRLLEGEIRGLPPGNYKIELDIPDLADKLFDEAKEGQKPQKLRADVSITGSDEDELVKLDLDEKHLQLLASKSEVQRVYGPEQVEELVSALEKKIDERTLSIDRPLWQWWLTLVLLIALLTAEWGTRKWVGLP